jgi:hypothetical protein
MRLISIIVLTFALGFSAFSQTVKVRSAGSGKARITSGKLQKIIDLSNDIAGCLSLYDPTERKQKRTDVTAFRLLDAVKKGTITYLLLHAPAGPNCNVQGYCGAAQDNTLIWLKLDDRLKVIKKKAVVIEDCQAQLNIIFPDRQDEDILNNLKLKLIGGELKVVSEKELNLDTEEYEETTVIYKHAAPENGLTVTTAKRKGDRQ